MPSVTEFLSNWASNGEGEAPGDVVEFGRAVGANHEAACRAALELLRWRYRAESPHTPYACLGSEWSWDGEAWSPFPGEWGFASIRGVRGFQLTTEAEALVQELADQEAAEPLAHQLIREAIDVSVANPRSALVIGVAALESGFKHLVAQLVPDAAWLAENAPSPPLVGMLKNYLPILPVRLRIRGEVLPCPKYARNILDAAVSRRNKVAHVGAVALPPDELNKLLDVGRDLLYLFDYYLGEQWAFDLLGVEFQHALIESVGSWKNKG
jgi:hypothetical protein